MALPTGSYCTSYMVVSYFTTVLLYWYYILQGTIAKHGQGYELVINMDSPFQTSYREYRNDFVVKILSEIMQKLVKSKCGDSIYCHNLSKDNNGCPAPDFCAVIPAGTYIFYKFRMIIEYQQLYENMFDFDGSLVCCFQKV